MHYNVGSAEGAGARVCPATQELRENIKQDLNVLINNLHFSLKIKHKPEILDLDNVAVVVLGGEELSISMYLIQHSLGPHY